MIYIFNLFGIVYCAQTRTETLSALEVLEKEFVLLQATINQNSVTTVKSMDECLRKSDALNNSTGPK